MYHLKDTIPTPYKHLREAHSLTIYNNVIIATYCHNTEGSGAVVSYQFDDNAGVIHWKTPSRDNNRGVLVYEQKTQ